MRAITTAATTLASIRRPPGNYWRGLAEGSRPPIALWWLRWTGSRRLPVPCPLIASWEPGPCVQTTPTKRLGAATAQNTHAVLYSSATSILDGRLPAHGPWWQSWLLRKLRGDGQARRGDDGVGAAVVHVEPSVAPQVRRGGE